MSIAPIRLALLLTWTVSLAASDDLPETFLAHLEQERFEQAHALFAESAAGALSVEQLAQIWRTLPDQLGGYSGRGAARVEQIQNRLVTVYRLEFAAMALDARISQGEDGRIDGFRLVPAAPQPDPSAVATSAEWAEQEVTVAGDLPGLLTVPAGAGPFPSAVLVHGSGPNNRDQTIGPNKPFRDLAHGLAEMGIATIRYDKRSLVQPEWFENRAYTVEEEVIDDARAALALLRTQSDIDPDRLFVIGHSLGALLGPRIAAAEPELAGLVLLAAPARPLDEVLIEQVTYIAGLDDEIDAGEELQLETLRTQAEAAGKLVDRGSAVPALLGKPESFWADLNAYDPIAAAEKLSVPIFLAQGGRDYQVTTEQDFARWKSALAGQAGVRFRLYESLNHLFIAGEGMATPSEYMTQAGHVDGVLMDDLAEFMYGRNNESE